MDALGLAGMLVSLLADVDAKDADTIAGARIQTATNFRDLGFDAVAAYELADRMTMVTVELAERSGALRETAERFLDLVQEITKKSERIERKNDERSHDEGTD